MFALAGRALLDRVLGPVAARLPHVSPNALSAGALAAACLAALCFYAAGDRPELFLAGAGLALLFGALDALDGIVARTHRKETAFGDFLDHTFDRLAAIVALSGLALSGHAQPFLVLVLMVGTLWHGYLGTQVEASFGVRVYRGLGIAEAILVAVAYGITAYGIRAAGLPFHFREPFSGALLSVTDAFILATYPLVIAGSIQRFAIGLALARGERPPRRAAAGEVRERVA